MPFTPGKLIELVVRSMPYPEQIRDITIEDSRVTFTWRDVTYCVTDSLGVDELRDGLLIGTDRALLVRTLLAARTTSKDYT